MKWPLLVVLGLVMSCSSGKKMSETGTTSIPEVVPVFTPGPHVMVYKTKGDLLKNVPVLLDDEGKRIVSYPHPSDLSVDGKLRLPTILKNGYLLDNKGINAQVAFLKLTYAEYAVMPEAPSLSEMNDLIVERDPLLELCDCGLRTAFTDVEAQLNQLIDNGKLRSSCKVVR